MSVLEFYLFCSVMSVLYTAWYMWRNRGTKDGFDLGIQGRAIVLVAAAAFWWIVALFVFAGVMEGLYFKIQQWRRNR